MSADIVATFRYVAGASVKLEYAVVDDDGIPANLTGTAIVFAARKYETPLADPAISSEGSPVTATINVTDITGGLFEVLINPEDTLGLLGTYLSEAKLTDASGDVAPVGRAFLIFKRGIA